MEIDTRTPSPMKKALLVYGPLFLVPAVAVFVLVLKHFQEALPARYEAKILFRVDPHLSGRQPAPGASGGGGTLMMDVRSIAIEIKSRDRMREALQGVALYREKKSREKKQLFLDHVLENMRVKVEREMGRNAYLVTLAVTLPVRHPERLHELVRAIRAVYKKYNVEQLIIRARQTVDSLTNQMLIRKRDFNNAENDLQSFLQKEDYRQHLGDPPPIVENLVKLKTEYDRLEGKEGDEIETRRNVLEKQIQQLEDEHKNTPAVQRRYKMLQERREDSLDRLQKIRGELKVAEDALRNLRSTSRDHFEIVDGPASRPVESERSSRLLLGVALGLIAGLAVVLLALLLSILGGRE